MEVLRRLDLVADEDPVTIGRERRRTRLAVAPAG